MSVYNKKKLFYFMKPDNFYDRDDIKRIDKMDNAGDILTLYDKLIFYTMNRDGLLAYKMGDEYEEYPLEEIADDFNYPVELVKETLEVFLKFHTIELTDDGYYFFPDALEYTKSTTVGAESKKSQRENRKKKQEIDNKEQKEIIEEIIEENTEDNCPGYIQSDTKIELKQDIQKDINTNKEIKENINKKIEVDTQIQLHTKYIKEIQEIIEYLNEKSHKNFTTESDFVKNLIVERLEENHSVDEFKSIIDCKVDNWMNNKEYNKNIRPGTLFSRSNFKKYLYESYGFKTNNKKTKLEEVLEEFEDD